MKVSRREIILAISAVTVSLYGSSMLLARERVETWRGLLGQRRVMLEQIESDKRLVGQKEVLSAKLEELSGMLPCYPADMKMDVHWLAVMDNLAAKHDFKITKRKPGKEEKIGDIYELSIVVPHEGWNGSLDAIVHFLFDLQREGAMLDIRRLSIRAKPGGLLGGSFSLYCAYTRENAVQGDQKE